ncbi:hypothetical protein [Staphylococcus warneri]|nr:hypothetical protein [Staphylococcus warneri]
MIKENGEVMRRFVGNNNSRRWSKESCGQNVSGIVGTSRGIRIGAGRFSG